jgi:hypothetical protein
MFSQRILPPFVACVLHIFVTETIAQETLAPETG